MKEAEASWDECIEANSSVRRAPNISKVKSLIDTAIGRIDYVSKNELNENSINYVFEDYYSSLSEFMHALVILKGYNVYNHICLGFFLRDVINRQDLFRLFDDCRTKRNSLVYYGKKMDFETATSVIEKAKKLIEELDKIIQELQK